ncbi:MAG: GNAT family N-acetyltransferase [Synergistaceae bacterium]|jgi:ribosomal protein S18 acetylase RimI-like enzyme|nr:GNAT family N-acetyltransferase [Synergistaceae bacterium]
MENWGYVHENLKSMLAILGEAESARYIAHTGTAAFYDSGVDDAHENYALPDQVNAARGADARSDFAETLDFAVKLGRKFFGVTGCPHIWPFFFEISGACQKILESNGLAREDDFTAMWADLNVSETCAMSDDRVRPVQANDVRGWADDVWRGFDSGEDASESFIAKARYFASRGEFLPVGIKGASTGLLFAGGETAGIYYISTRPEFRGQGLGGAVVDYLKRAARESGFRYVTLLATPSGRRLYERHGFIALGTVSIFSGKFEDARIEEP